jgi:hypothetical protein
MATKPKTRSATGKVLVGKNSSGIGEYQENKYTARTTQGAGRAAKAAKDQGKARVKMADEAAVRAERLGRSNAAANRWEFTSNKMTTKAQDKASEQNYKASLRRKPANRPNAKRVK